MSLSLDFGTKPSGLEIETRGAWGDVVCLGEYKISMADFFEAVKYVLTNTDLEPNDLRLEFVKYVRSITEVEGFNGTHKKRLISSV